MNDFRKEKIVCPHVILCEGRDELRFCPVTRKNVVRRMSDSKVIYR